MNTLNHKLEILNQVFFPSAPIDEIGLFFGRKKQLDDIHMAVHEKGQHVILYGERGVGKTSLANIVQDLYQGAFAVKTTCSRDLSFQDIWDSIFRKIPLIFESRKIGFTDNEQEKIQTIIRLSEVAPTKEEINTNSILALLENVESPLLLIFDEFDTISEKGIKKSFADIIKSLSDNNPNVTVMVVGISDNVMQLIGEHQSLDRCTKQIRLPRMDDPELKEIIDHASGKLELTFETIVKKRIIYFSMGYPHYTHLLGKYSAYEAIKSKAKSIGSTHFDVAIREAIDNASESIRSAYQNSITSSKTDNFYKAVLGACALTDEDEHGMFRLGDLSPHIFKITGKHLGTQSYQYHIGKFCSNERGNILQKVKIIGKQHKYKFSNPLFKAFILLKLYDLGINSDKMPIA